MQAFRRAAATVDALEPAELARLDVQGRLETLPGVGKSTATVISEARSGSVPAYLQPWSEARPCWYRPVRSLLVRYGATATAIRTGRTAAAPIADMAAAARAGPSSTWPSPTTARGLTVANGLSADDLRRQLDVVGRRKQGDLAPFRLLTGIEVDILDDGSLDQEPELLTRLDVVVASAHSKLRMEAVP